MDDRISKICDKSKYDKTIFISCLEGASNQDEVGKLGIDVVVTCCRAKIPLEKRNEGTTYIHIPFRDWRGVDLISKIKLFCQKIKDYETVLVNCRLGISRSVSLVIGYFIREGTFMNVPGVRGLCYYDYAFDIVWLKRIDALPNSDFIYQLRRYASEICWSPIKDVKDGGEGRRHKRVQKMIDRPNVQIALLSKTYVHNLIFSQDEKRRKIQEEEDVIITDSTTPTKVDTKIKKDIPQRHSECWAKIFNGTIIDTSIEDRWGILSTFHSFVDKTDSFKEGNEPPGTKTASIEISSSESSGSENWTENKRTPSERSDSIDVKAPQILSRGHTIDKSFFESSLSMDSKLRKIEAMWHVDGPKTRDVVRCRLLNLKEELSFILIYHFDRREDHVGLPFPDSPTFMEFLISHYTLAIRKFRTENRIHSSKSNTTILDEHWESIYEKYPIEHVLNVEGGCVMFIKPYEPHIYFDYHREWDLFIASVEIHPHTWDKRKSFLPKVVFPEPVKSPRKNKDYSGPISSSDTKEEVKKGSVLHIEGMVQKFVVCPRNMFMTMFFFPHYVVQLSTLTCTRLDLSHRGDGAGRPVTREYSVTGEGKLRESIVSIQRGVFEQCPSANMSMAFRLPEDISSSLVPGVYDLNFDISCEGVITSYIGFCSITILSSEEDFRKEQNGLSKELFPVDGNNNNNNKLEEEEETEGEELNRPEIDGEMVGKCGRFEDIPSTLDQKGFKDDCFRGFVNEVFDPRGKCVSEIRRNGSGVWDLIPKVVEDSTRKLEVEFDKWYDSEYFKILFQENEEACVEFMNTRTDLHKSIHRTNEIGFEVLEKYKAWIGLENEQGEIHRDLSVQPVDVLQSHRQFTIISRSLTDLVIRLLKIGRLLPRRHRERAKGFKKPSEEEKLVREGLMKKLKNMYREYDEIKPRLKEEDRAKKLGYVQLFEQFFFDPGFSWRRLMDNAVSIVNEWKVSRVARDEFVRKLRSRYNYSNTLLAHLKCTISSENDPFYPEFKIVRSPYGRQLSGSAVFKLLTGKNEEEKREMEERKKKVVVIQAMLSTSRARYLEGKQRILCVDLSLHRIQKFIRRHLERVQKIFLVQENY